MTDFRALCADVLQVAYALIDCKPRSWDTIVRHQEVFDRARTALAQPAPPAPIGLDELLSPKGAYEPGTGHEDGAQLVDQREWWAPVYGCDTLDILLDQIRARILPHLRPPIAGIDVPGGDGDYGDVLDLCAAEGVDPRVGVQLLKRAREAWGNTAHPAPPAEGEVGELVAWLRMQGEAQKPGPNSLLSDRTKDERHAAGTKLARAADLLEQRHPAPVPVSERLQQMEDLAADAVSALRYIEQSHGRLYGIGWDRVYEKANQLRPAHALPLPAGEVQP